jgi:CMP-N-acetylneuraminic acid synthetase
MYCAWEAACDVVAVSSDRELQMGWADARYIERPAELATDSAPMIAVVQHALQQIPGEPDDILVLLQPTAPLRKPAHIQEAVRLLRETQADSVVSVVPLPLTHSPEFQCEFANTKIHGKAWEGRILPYPVWEGYEETRTRFDQQPKCRQEATQPYIRDGTVYAFKRSTVTRFRDIYGKHVRGLVIDPADSCTLDEEADWTALQARWEARGTAARS